MKKIFKIFLFISIFCSLFVVRAYAEEINLDVIKDEIVSEKELTQSITGDSKNILGDIEISPNTDLATETMSLIDRAKIYINSAIESSTNTFVQIFIVIVISSVGIGFASANDLKSINNYINMATSITICSIILLDVRSVLSICTIAIAEIEAFSKVLMPAMVTAISFSGSPTTAVLSQTASMFAFNLVINLINNLLFPFTYIYIGIASVNSSIANDTLTKLLDFIKWLTSTSLKVILTIFIAYMSITGVVSGTVDSFALKTTKFATGFIPVVGSIISDASETILVGASVVKNSLGIFGILSILAICIVPFTHIFINYLLFKVASVIFSPISSKQVTKLLDSISVAFNMAMSMLTTSALIMFIMIIIGIMVVRQV